MLTLTPKAQKAISGYPRSTHVPDTAGLRICRHRDRTGFHVALADTPEKDDQVLERDGARVFLGPVAALRFAEWTLDVREDHLGRLEFVVRER